MCITYIFFYRACKAQGLDRKTLPYTGWFQPYCAWIALVWLIVFTCIYGKPAQRQNLSSLVLILITGYNSYLPWSTSTFFSQYTMQIFIPPLYLIWKFIKKTKVVKPHEVIPLPFSANDFTLTDSPSQADLVWDRPVIDAYEATFLGPPVGFWTEMGQLIGIGRHKGGNEQRRSSSVVIDTEK